MHKTSLQCAELLEQFTTIFRHPQTLPHPVVETKNNYSKALCISGANTNLIHGLIEQNLLCRRLSLLTIPLVSRQEPMSCATIKFRVCVSKFPNTVMKFHVTSEKKTC